MTKYSRIAVNVKWTVFIVQCCSSYIFSCVINLILNKRFSLRIFPCAQNKSQNPKIMAEAKPKIVQLVIVPLTLTHKILKQFLFCLFMERWPNGIAIGRTLTIRGSKKVIRTVQRINATTHSYTIRKTDSETSSNFIWTNRFATKSQGTNWNLPTFAFILEQIWFDGQRNCQTMDARGFPRHGWWRQRINNWLMDGIQRDDENATNRSKKVENYSITSWHNPCFATGGCLLQSTFQRFAPDIFKSIHQNSRHLRNFVLALMDMTNAKQIFVRNLWRQKNPTF